MRGLFLCSDSSMLTKPPEMTMLTSHFTSRLSWALPIDPGGRVFEVFRLFQCYCIAVRYIWQDVIWGMCCGFGYLVTQEHLHAR